MVTGLWLDVCVEEISEEALNNHKQLYMVILCYTQLYN
jgi:hypothetical protein